jgi:hypothetical protein
VQLQWVTFSVELPFAHHLLLDDVEGTILGSGVYIWTQGS